jgi:hypothetical protein
MDQPQQELAREQQALERTRAPEPQGLASPAQRTDQPQQALVREQRVLERPQAPEQLGQA